MNRKKMPEKKKRVNNSTPVRIGNGYIRIAEQIKVELNKNSIGEVVEQCILYFKNSM